MYIIILYYYYCRIEVILVSPALDKRADEDIIII